MFQVSGFPATARTYACPSATVPAIALIRKKIKAPAITTAKLLYNQETK